MNNLQKFYPELAKLYKEYSTKAEALYSEFADKVGEIIPTGNTTYVSNMFTHGNFIQVYPDKASDNAVFSFEDDEGAKYYKVNINGVEISECVRKNR